MAADTELDEPEGIRFTPRAIRRHIRRILPGCPDDIRDRLIERVNSRDWGCLRIETAIYSMAAAVIRHELTDYEKHLNVHKLERNEARLIVGEEISDTLSSWQAEGYKDQYLLGLKAEGRISPAEVSWHGFWEFLERHRRTVEDTGPPKPLTFAMPAGSDEEVHQRLGEQLEWAIENGCLSEAIEYLRGVPEESWNHRSAGAFTR